MVSQYTFTKAHKQAHKTGGICSGCAEGKFHTAPMQRRKKHPKNSPISSPFPLVSKPIPDPLVPNAKPGQLVFMDILFSSAMALHSRNTMALILVDFASRFVWTFPMSSKDDAPNKICEWAQWMKTNGYPTPAYTTIRSDCDSVFTSSTMTT